MELARALPSFHPDIHDQEEPVMADDGGGNAMLGLVLGGLLVFVAMVFVFGWAGKDSKTVSIEAPKITTPR
jgi:hypothetical protein